MKVLAFAASNSQKSINKQLVSYAANKFKTDIFTISKVEILDLNDFEMPLFSIEREKEGIPDLAKQFYKKIGQADALLISYAEHNGNYTAAYKNLFDWMTRIDQKVFQGKRMVIFATSPGPGGANTVLEMAKTSASYFGADIKASVSVPSFFENFDPETGLMKDTNIDKKIADALKKLV